MKTLPAVFSVLACALPVLLRAALPSLPTVDTVEWQPLSAQVKRVVEASR